MKQQDYKHENDILSLILTDDLFKDNDEMIVDESITFIVAGTQTTAVTTSNLICYYTQHTDILDKIREDCQNCFKNYGKSNIQLAEETFNWENAR